MKRTFSDRIGITGPKALLLDSMSVSLRNSLWNLLLDTIFTRGEDTQRHCVKFICARFLKLPRDLVPYTGYHAREWLRNTFCEQSFDWWQVYNLIEFLAENPGQTIGTKSLDKFIAEANRILEEEGAGYRFLGATLSPITNTQEVSSIEESIAAARATNLFGTAHHLESAVDLLSKKPKADYRNSIKESISATESLVKQITGEEGGGLDKALATLDAQVGLHGAFKSGILSLYGYTSDEDGIRHAILEEPNVGFDEAKYMLVACSALVNYIISKASRYRLVHETQK